MSKPKILEQIENAGGVFVATKGTTTYQEIKDAYDSGKDVIVPYDGNIYELVTIPTGSNKLNFQRRIFSNNGFATTCYRSMNLTAANVWDDYTSTTTSALVASPIFTDNATTVISSIGYYRPIRVSTEEPTASDGYTGDIWIQYEAD